MADIDWQTDMIAALEQARSEKKNIFVAFSNPGCKMCSEMDTVTFPDEKVCDFFSSHLIALKFSSSKNPEKYLRFKVVETPTYIVLGTNGREVVRMTGFLSSGEIIEKLEDALL